MRRTMGCGACAMVVVVVVASVVIHVAGWQHVERAASVARPERASST